MNVSLCTRHIACTESRQRALYRKLALLRVTIQRAGKGLRLHVALPIDNGLTAGYVRQRHRTVDVSRWQHVLPVEGVSVGILVVVNDSDVAGLRSHWRKHIIRIVLFSDKRLRTAFQNDGRRVVCRVVDVDRVEDS